MGRLFDAVAATLGIRDRVNYEGQAAIELEQLADPSERASYKTSFQGEKPFTVAGADLINAVVADIDANVPAPVIAARFHNGVAALILDAASRLRATTGLETVALSGGVFQNMFLLERAVSGLEAAGFEVLTHHRVPPNDAGISLGQAAVATSRST